jgi:hypothetical protein
MWMAASLDKLKNIAALFRVTAAPPPHLVKRELDLRHVDVVGGGVEIKIKGPP